MARLAVRTACAVLLFLCLFGRAVVGKDKTHYEVLGLRKDASEDSIKQQYRKLAKQYHPDKNRDDPSANEKFIEVSSAYETLSDPGKRRTYDQILSAPQSQGQPMHGRGGHHQPGFHPGFRFPSNQFPNEFSSAGGRSFVFERRASNGRSYTFSYSFGGAGPGQQFYYDNGVQRQSLLSQLISAVWLSPIPMIFSFFAIYWCASRCCSSRAADDRDRQTYNRENIRQHSSHLPRDVSSEGSASKADDDLASSIRQRKCITIIPCSVQALSVISKLKRSFKADPLLFCNKVPSEIYGVELNDRDNRETVQVIAASKGGSRWCQLKCTENAEDMVDRWLVKLLNGEMVWTDAPVSPLPFQLPS
jgi:curved DNA-binding protein CbpA